jgi:hypothetical protein
LALGTGGEWPSFLLVPEYIDEGLLFSTLCMVCYLAGYTFTEKRAKVPRWSRLAQPALLPRVNYKLLLCLSLLSVVLFIILVGGPGEVWEGSRARGEGQFDARDLAGKFRQMANVLQFALDFSLACVAAVFILRRGLSLPMRMLGYGCLVVSALPSVFSFSRGVGMPFVVLGFLALRLRKRSGLKLAAACFGIAVYLGWVSMNARYSAVGLGYYLNSAVSFDPTAQGWGGYANSIPGANMLDAMAAWTRKTSLISVEGGGTVEMAANFLWNLSPVPSELLPLRPVGRDLAEVMGTWGSSGITTPALADTYYAFGSWGCLGFVLLGALFAYFEKVASVRGGIVAHVCVLFCLAGLLTGLHASARGLTRPVLYACIIYFISRQYASKLAGTSKARPVTSLRRFPTRTTAQGFTRAGHR